LLEWVRLENITTIRSKIDIGYFSNAYRDLHWNYIGVAHLFKVNNIFRYLLT